MNEQNTEPSPSPRKPTLATVAACAGVSPASASMILTGRQGVSFSAETVARVLEAADSLGYMGVRGRKRPVNSLRGKTVLIVCPNVINAYYATLIQAIEQAAWEKGYKTSIHTTYRSLEGEMEALSIAEDGEYSGIIFTMVAYPREVVARLAKNGIAAVAIADRTEDLALDSVELNNYEAGSQIARLMHSLGHRYIAYVATSLDSRTTMRTQRLKGLRDTFLALDEKADIRIESREVSPETERGNVNIEYTVGYETTRELFADSRLTAIVAVNDMVAYGVIDAIRCAGLHVPKDYSVCGFDNIFPSRFAGISLTSVDHHVHEKGRNAMEMLHTNLSGAASGNNIVRIEFKHNLVERDSTAPPRRTEPEQPPLPPGA